MNKEKTRIIEKNDNFVIIITGNASIAEAKIIPRKKDIKLDIEAGLEAIRNELRKKV